MEVRICKDCHKELPLDCFSRFKGRGDKIRINTSCPDCVKTEKSKRYQERRLVYLESAKKTRRAQRELALWYYGGACRCCGESRYEFLTFDHINGRSDEHRRQSYNGTGFSSYRLLKWIIKNNYPDNIQILCYNCNCSKGYHGRCPHAAESQDVDRNDQRQLLEQILFDLEVA